MLFIFSNHENEGEGNQLELRIRKGVQGIETNTWHNQAQLENTTELKVMFYILFQDTIFVH